MTVWSWKEAAVLHETLRNDDAIVLLGIAPDQGVMVFLALEIGSQAKEVFGRIKNKDDGDHEDVEMGFAEFPLRAIHGAKATDDAEAAEVKVEAAKVAAIALTTTLREGNYQLAQASVGLIEGALGKEHPGAIRARGIRGSMSHSTVRPPSPAS
jgi:hypothetical protein